MKLGAAIKLADQQGYQTGISHFVVWDPLTIKESLTFSGYQVKSKNEMIEDYGSLEAYSLHISYVSREAS